MRFPKAALLAAVLLIAPICASADVDTHKGPPQGIQTTSVSLANVLALNKKAEGKQLDSFATHIEEWSFRQGGSDGIERIVWAGRDYKATSTFGPIAYANGRRAGTRWRQDFNGLTVVVSGVHQEEDAFESAMTLARNGHPGADMQLLGEVTTPGQFPYVPDMTVETAVAVAGGFTPRAQRRRVELHRQVDGQATHGTVPIGYPVRPGDTIVVAERWF